MDHSFPQSLTLVNFRPLRQLSKDVAAEYTGSKAITQFIVVKARPAFTPPVAKWLS